MGWTSGNRIWNKWMTEWILYIPLNSNAYLEIHKTPCASLAFHKPLLIGFSFLSPDFCMEMTNCGRKQKDVFCSLTLKLGEASFDFNACVSGRIVAGNSCEGRRRRGSTSRAKNLYGLVWIIPLALEVWRCHRVLRWYTCHFCIELLKANSQDSAV